MRTISKFISLCLIFVLGMVITHAQEAQTISYDEVVTGELDEQTYEQLYSFEGEAGDTIVIRMSAQDEEIRLDSYLYLRDAEGNQLAFDDDTAGFLNALIGPYTLESTGTYTIVATRYQQAQGTSTGAYELTVSLADSELLTLGEELELELNATNSLVISSFVAEESGIYQLSYRLISGVGSADVSLRNNTGANVTAVHVDQNNTHNFTIFRLEAGEAISLFARYYASYDNQGNQIEDSNIQVALSVELVEAEALNLDIEQPAEVSGILEDESSVDYYTFSAENGQTLEIQGDAPNGGDFEVYILMPAGYTSFYGSNSYQQPSLVSPQIITQTGEFVLVVHPATYVEGNEQAVESLAYDLTVILTNTPELVSGEAVEGSIDNRTQVYEDAYIYNGSEGENITVSLTSLDDAYQLSFSMSLEPADPTNDPNGGFYANFSSSAQGTMTYEFTLPRDGAYIVRVYDGFYGPESQEAGSYNLLIESN